MSGRRKKALEREYKKLFGDAPSVGQLRAYKKAYRQAKRGGRP